MIMKKNLKKEEIEKQSIKINLHTETKNIINRISRATGHLNSIKQMVEEGRDCSEVLIQLSAVKGAINNIGKIVLKDHLEHCILQALKDGDSKTIEDFEKAIEKFLR